MAGTDCRLRTLVAKVRATGGRITPQRLAVLRVLAEAESHPTAVEVFRQVKEHCPVTSLATVYKTLALLESLGEVVELPVRRRVSRYDSLDPRPHPHLVCSQCEAVEDVQVPGLAELLKDVGVRARGWILSEALDLWGICPRCRCADPLSVRKAPDESCSAS